MNKVGLVIVLSLLSTLTFGFQKKYKYDFVLIIGSCFQSDTLTIQISGQQLVDNVIVESDPVTGVARLSIFQDKDRLWVLMGEKDKIKLDRLELKKEIPITIFVNGTKTTLTINLKKGKIVLVDNCSVKLDNGQISKRLTFRQHKKPVTLE